VTRITVANTWTAADTYTLTIDNIDFILTIGTLVTTAQVATTIYQSLTGTTFTDTTASATIPPADGGASLIPQFSEFTATNLTASQVDLTANGAGALAGKPFTIVVTGDGTASTGTAAISSITVPTSQYHADQVDNYSGNALPTGGSDTLIFDNGSVDVRWGLDYATTLTAITKYKAYTGNVGLSEVNTDNTAKPYHEYRTTYLTCTGCTTVNHEVGDGPGSGRFKLNTGTGQSAINIFGQGTRLESGVPCFLWKGTHASNTFNNLRGDAGIAFFGGETATVATLVTGDGPLSQASTICGTGCTLTTVTLNGGTQETNSAITTANQNGGNWTHKAGTITTANIYGGTHYPVGAATYTTLKLFGGTFDASRGNASFAITNTIQLYKGAIFRDPQGRVSGPVFKLNGCTMADVTIDIPKDKTYTVS
jgi:hypothetical protein